MTLVKLAASVVVSLFGFSAQAVTIAQTTFDAGLDGWTEHTGDQWIFTYESTGGTPGGYAKGQDRLGQPSYYVAPPKFLGNWSALDNAGSLDWDHVTLLLGPGPTPITNAIVARISGPSSSAIVRFDATSTVEGAWTHFSVPISSESWTMTSGTWQSLISNVTGVWLNGEFINNTHASPDGAEMWGIDNIVLASAVSDVPSSLSALLGIGTLFLIRRPTSLRCCWINNAEDSYSLERRAFGF